MGAREQQLAELDDAAPAQPGQVDDAGERVERLGGADVRGRFLPADVLLAGLQRQHEPAPPVHVDGLARDPPGHPAQVGLARGEQPERRAAEVEPVAERLALADGDVHAAFAGRGEHAERDRVDLGDHERTGRRRKPAPSAPSSLDRRLGGGAERGGVLDGAVEVGLGEDRGARVGVDRLRPRIGVGDAVAKRDLDDLHAIAVRVGAQRLDRVRVHARR